jgi:hypothetical protein
MDRFNDSGRRPRPSSARRRVTRAVVGILLIAAGVSLRFALAATSAPGVGLHDVGIVAIIIGIVVLLLVPAPTRGWLRTRWVSLGELEPNRGPGAAHTLFDYDYDHDKGAVAAERPPAVEFGPPPEAAAGKAGPP